MDALKIKHTKMLLNTNIEFVGAVIASFATNTGWWLKVADSKGYTLFVFSPQFNFNLNDVIVVRGVVKESEAYGVYIEGARVLRRSAAALPYSYNQQIAAKVTRIQQNAGLLSKIDPKLSLLIAIIVSLIIGFFLYPLLSG